MTRRPTPLQSTFLLLVYCSSILITKARDPITTASTLAEHRKAFTAGTCRGLHDYYTDLHKRINNGEQAQRYLVFKSPPSGIADRLTGLVAAFYFALLTRRALLIPPYPMPYETLYDQPFINWTTPPLNQSIAWPVTWPPGKRTCLRCAQPKSTSASPSAEPSSDASAAFSYPELFKPDQHTNCLVCEEEDGRTVSYLNWINHPRARLWHRGTNLTAVLPDVHTIYYTSNRGITISLFHNRFHNRQLTALGLRPSTAFGCAYNYLFFPRPETLEVVAEERAALLSAPLVIGIQIRTDDKHMLQGDMETALAARYDNNFQCAAQLEAELMMAGEEEAGKRQHQRQLLQLQQLQQQRQADQPGLLLQDRQQEQQQQLSQRHLLQQQQLSSRDAELQHGLMMSKLQHLMNSERMKELLEKMQTDQQAGAAAATTAAAPTAARSQGSGVRWFLVSDSGVVRRHAAARYGDKVIVHLKTNPRHVSHTGQVDMHGSRLAAAEHWLFGMSDYQVISYWSGYGRTAALRSLREMNVIVPSATADPDPKSNPNSTAVQSLIAPKVGCGLEDMQGPWELGEGYSGVRRRRGRTRRR
ncbi:hypothetical protein Agub_g3873 [Astrephomene gubernaculifera]|uniref:Uncharacterized protein n=1 Tax=Astrephomene gubernaculifera TaxID=47775 RepID=A0AAD3DJA8_9CHLO|nr:hypothetical protein Agub_g3873 [Astrephomene gubernaculifera]